MIFSMKHPQHHRARLLRALVRGTLGVGLILLGVALPARAGLLGTAPSNDAFSSPAEIQGGSSTSVGSSIAATRETAEPDHAGKVAAASVWWIWTAPDTGPVVIDTEGSSFDTLLAVYTGGTLESLKLVAASDDAPGVPTSRVLFRAEQGVTYRIVVDGYQGASGSIHLRLVLASNPTPPAILSQPVGQIVPGGVGTNVLFSVLATGSMPRALQWQKDGIDLAGRTLPLLVLSNVMVADTGDYRVVVRNDFGSVTSSIARLTVLEQGGQDQFSERIALGEVPVLTTGYNVGASIEAGEPRHRGVDCSASIWWSWKASRSGRVRISTAGSQDAKGDRLTTVVGVYRGEGLSSLNPVRGFPEEAVDGVVSGGNGSLVFRATAGTTYQIAVASATTADGSATTGRVELVLDQSVDNDAFANALSYPADHSTVVDDSTGASIEPGEPSHARQAGGHSVWWRWVAPEDGIYELDTEGSAFDTVLAVYTGDRLDSLRVVAEDDDRSDEGASMVKFQVQKETVYHFVVDGEPNQGEVESGPIRLNLNRSLALNDLFADRVTLSGQTNRVSATNVGATKEAGEPEHGGNRGGRSVWWSWMAPLTGPVVITTLNSTFDTSLGVYIGNDVQSLSLVAENEDLNPLDPQSGSAVAFKALAGQRYEIAVDGYRSGTGEVAEGTVELAIIQPTLPPEGGNDLFAKRFSLMGATNLVAGSNGNATKESGEPDHGGNIGGKSVWWSWVAPATGPVIIGTLGSSFRTVLAIYQGGSLGGLDLVDEDERSGLNQSSVVTFNAVEGAEYQIAVDGFNDGDGAESGRVVLSLRQFPAGPLGANDAFLDATPISSLFPFVVGSNLGASREPGEPAHAGVRDGRSIWWTWTAPVDAAIAISTEDSDFDTVLAVYVGDELSSLRRVAENDDIDLQNPRSRVAFMATEGTTYRIAVDGYGMEMGEVRLSVQPLQEVSQVPVVRQEPRSQTRFRDGTGGGIPVVFEVVATGQGPISYQWTKDQVAIEGATGPVLTLSNPGPADAGSYQVAVRNPLGETVSRTARFNWLDMPFNDDFGRRIPVEGSPTTRTTVHGSILGATKQPGEPEHGGEMGGASVWWSFVASADGLFEVNTRGSGFDTLLAVYEGDEVDHLTLVGENNNVVEGGDHSSRVRFTAIAGRHYQIAVDAQKPNEPSGGVVLNIGAPGSPMEITQQPSGPGTVLKGSAAFRLQVGVTNETPAVRYQWYRNDVEIAGANQPALLVDPKGRDISGRYQVRISDGPSTLSSDLVQVWVAVPQVLEAPQFLRSGNVVIRFSDPDGTLCPLPARLEIQSADGMNAIGGWRKATGTVTQKEGRFQFEETSASGGFLRLYRVIEK